VCLPSSRVLSAPFAIMSLSGLPASTLAIPTPSQVCCVATRAFQQDRKPSRVTAPRSSFRKRPASYFDRDHQRTSAGFISLWTEMTFQTHSPSKVSTLKSVVITTSSLHADRCARRFPPPSRSPVVPSAPRFHPAFPLLDFEAAE